MAAASTGTLKERVTPKMLFAALTDAQKQKLSKHDDRITELEKVASAVERRLRAYQGQRRIQGGGYFGIAHALLNSKEFIYVH